MLITPLHHRLGDNDGEVVDVGVEKLEEIILKGYRESFMASYQETVMEFQVRTKDRVSI